MFNGEIHELVVEDCIVCRNSKIEAKLNLSNMVLSNVKFLKGNITEKVSLINFAVMYVILKGVTESTYIPCELK